LSIFIRNWSLNIWIDFVNILVTITNEKKQYIFIFMRLIFIGKKIGPKVRDIFYFFGYKDVLNNFEKFGYNIK